MQLIRTEWTGRVKYELRIVFKKRCWWCPLLTKKVSFIGMNKDAQLSGSGSMFFNEHSRKHVIHSTSRWVYSLDHTLTHIWHREMKIKANPEFARPNTAQPGKEVVL